MQTERHPLEPFLPDGTRMLMLGSFPPPRSKWSMDFYYPNLQNDMWRIFGIVFFGDKNHFMHEGCKAFSVERITGFLTERRIGLSDTAAVVHRQKGNASDQFLEIVEKVDLVRMLDSIPECRYIVTTGQKATETLLSITGAAQPAIGSFTEFNFASRKLRHYRMPSSSRAYPKPVGEKADVYRAMFSETGIL